MKQPKPDIDRAQAHYETYGPPYCLLAINLDMSDKDGRKQAVEFCKQCVKLTPGEEKKSCEEILKKFK